MGACKQTAMIAIPCCTAYPDTLRPRPQPDWALPDPKTIYFHESTTIQGLHARLLVTKFIYLLPVTWFMMRGRALFVCEQIILYCLGML